jgi:hypothetical protein
MPLQRLSIPLLRRRLAVAVLPALRRRLPAVAGLLRRRGSVLARRRSVLPATAGADGTLILAVVRAVDGSEDQLHQLYDLLAYMSNVDDVRTQSSGVRSTPFLRISSDSLSKSGWC